MKKQLVKALGLVGVLALGLAACGEDAETPPVDNTPDPINIAVSGSLTIHKISGVVASNNMTTLSWGAANDITLALVDPVDVISNPTGFTPLAVVQLDPSTQCVNLQCAWSVDRVNIVGLSLGLVAIVSDSRTAKQFVTTATGLMGASTVAGLQSNPVAATGLAAMAVSDESVGFLATNAAASKTDWLANGLVFGSMLNVAADGPAPVSAALVSVDAANASKLDVTYPMGGGASGTGPYGFFLATAVAPTTGTAGAVVADWTATSAGKTWTGVTAGTNPGTVFVLNWLAD